MNRANHTTDSTQRDLLCLNCYRTGHHRFACKNQGIIACSICFLSNVFTQRCNHQKPQNQNPIPRQTLRFVHGNIMYVDVDVYGQTFEALVNPSSKVTKIGISVLEWLYELGHSSKEEHPSHLRVPLLTMGQPIELICKVTRFLENPLELGTDFMVRHGFKFQLGNIQIDSKRSPIMKNPTSFEYLYNMEPWGDDLRSYLNRKRELQHRNT